MGKPTGFMEYKRELPQDRSALKRIKDWNEFHSELPEEKQRNQGARCMDCGIPFCHSGIMINGMASGCPIHNLIPEWNDLIFKGLWKEAWERLIKTNNFPEFTGRVCPAPCEGACTVGINDPQVTIKNNECTLIERAWKEGWVVPQSPLQRTGKKVAVVGSGPAGLACADQLNKAGHWVTVFERADRIGGILMYGIPNMKLDKVVIKRRVDLMSMEGVQFVVSTEIGKDLLVESLTNEFDAIVLCGGATKPRDLLIEGRDVKGIYFAMDFLGKNTKSLLDTHHKDGMFISTNDKDVIIIGGGDTGTDCVGTSIRQGCRSVTQLEIMPQPALERTADNPWPQWPKILKVDYGHEEAIAVFGKDPREYCITAKRFIGDENGQLKEVHTVNVEWKKDASGRFVPVEVIGSEKVWSAQFVFIAMGFIGPEDLLIKELELEQDNRSNIQTGNGTYQTNKEGIFAAGDMRRGQSLVVWAIYEGRGAAQECNEFLMGTKKPL